MNNEQRNDQQGKDAHSVDLQNINRIQQAEQDSTTKKPQEEDTSKEIISTHDDRSQDEGVDEQYGGDAMDNRDDQTLKDDDLI